MLVDIILYLLHIIQDQQRIIGQLLNFICRYIPLKQWAFDDSHSPKYQKYRIDELPKIQPFNQDWTYKELLPYWNKRYGKLVKPVSRRIFRNPVPAQGVRLRPSISTRTMAPRVSSYAKSAMQDSLRMRGTVSLP